MLIDLITTLMAILLQKKDFNKDKWWLGWTCEHD